MSNNLSGGLFTEVSTNLIGENLITYIFAFFLHQFGFIFNAIADCIYLQIVQDTLRYFPWCRTLFVICNYINLDFSEIFAKAIY